MNMQSIAGALFWSLRNLFTNCGHGGIFMESNQLLQDYRILHLEAGLIKALVRLCERMERSMRSTGRFRLWLPDSGLLVLGEWQTQEPQDLHAAGVKLGGTERNGNENKAYDILGEYIRPAISGSLKNCTPSYPKPDLKRTPMLCSRLTTEVRQ